MSVIGKLFIFLLVIMVSKCENIRPRVFNGRDALKDEYPYVVVYVLYDRKLKHPIRACTGSLISRTCVLTAAHCLDMVKASWTVINMNLDYIQFGDVTAPFNSTSLRKILKKVIHPRFLYNKNLKHIENDIGLAFIQTLVMKTFGKLSAIDYTTLIGLPVVFVGYGSYSYKPDLTELNYKPLQVGEGVISSCPSVDDVEWEPILCVASKCGPDEPRAAQGDSGGPLIVNNKIVGVHCGTFIGVTNMTPVSIYLDWIRLNMAAEENLRRIKESEE